MTQLQFQAPSAKPGQELQAQKLEGQAVKPRV